jgi:hypothetical protein
MIKARVKEIQLALLCLKNSTSIRYKNLHPKQEQSSVHIRSIMRGRRRRLNLQLLHIEREQQAPSRLPQTRSHQTAGCGRLHPFFMRTD